MGHLYLYATWKEFKNVQNIFLRKFLQVKQQKGLLFLEIGTLHTMITTMERVAECMFKVEKSSLNLLLGFEWEASNKI